MLGVMQGLTLKAPKINVVYINAETQITLHPHFTDKLTVCGKV